MTKLLDVQSHDGFIFLLLTTDGSRLAMGLGIGNQFLEGHLAILKALALTGHGPRRPYH